MWINRRVVRKVVWRHFLGGIGHDASLSGPVGSPVWRVGVTPSDACGLGRASSSAKGWVLTMLPPDQESGGARGSGPAARAALLTRPPSSDRLKASGRRASLPALSRGFDLASGGSNKGLGKEENGFGG